MKYQMQSLACIFVFDLKVASAIILVRCVSLLTGVLGCYCYAGILTEEEARKSKLFHKAKVEVYPFIFYI